MIDTIIVVSNEIKNLKDIYSVISWNAYLKAHFIVREDGFVFKNRYGPSRCYLSKLVKSRRNSLTSS